MNYQDHALEALAAAKFGVGQPVTRSEDPILVRGQGRYTDDVSLPGQAYAVFVRSRHAHGLIRRIEAAAARAMPGVLAVYTGHDLAAYGPLKTALPLKNRDGRPLGPPPRPALPTDKVRFVGDPVAVVVAETVQQAKDAAEAVEVEIEPLPVVTGARAAAEAGAPQVWDGAPGNIALDYHYGDSEQVAKAFAQAAHVTRLRLENSRLVVDTMKPRAALAAYEAASGRFTLNLGTQGVFGMRSQLVDILGVPADKIHVLTGHVGGSFGMKAAAYPEYVGLLHAARALGRPVKWTDERSGSFVSDQHGRDHDVDAELALDKDGNFLALRLTVYGNLGGFVGAMAPLMPTLNVVKNVNSVYRTPLIEVNSKCVFTNTTLVSAYRGAGRPESNYYMERLIDAAAAELGIDRIELRRRNHITPQQIPYAAASGMKYDSGDFPAVLDEALALADIEGFPARRQESRARGLLRGLGIGCYLEVTAGGTKEMGAIRFEADGGVTIVSGTLDFGQGHATAFGQVLSEKLKIPFERIRLVQGDSDQLVLGGGTGGSRSIMNGGAAILEAADLVVDKGKQIASQVLEASAADIEFRDGAFVIAGTDRSVALMELAAKLRAGGLKLPAGAPQSLDVTHVSNGMTFAFPNGCHVCEVEIDPETGVVEVVRYASVNDFGTVINPLLVEGQVHGGVVQGIGQALLERTVYDADGQLLSGSFMDYAMPRAANVPAIVNESHPVPATTNPLGAKGCGEAGCAGGLACVMNAVVDALSVYGIRHLDMPATPERVWQAIRAATAHGAA